MNTKFNTMSPARQQYTQKRAEKKGMSVVEYLTRNQPKPRRYPFSQIEDAQFAVILATTDTEKRQIATLMSAYKTAYEEQGGKMTDLTDRIIARPTDPVSGINGTDDTERMCYTYLVSIGTHTVGMVQTGTTIDSAGKPIGTFINDVYVRPEYRGWGVSTRIYQYCVNHMRSNAITIAYNRVKGKCEYWSQWFNRWVIDPYYMLQKPNGQALITLTSADYQSRVQGLTTETSLKRNIDLYFKALKRLQMQMAAPRVPA